MNPLPTSVSPSLSDPTSSGSGRQLQTKSKENEMATAGHRRGHGKKRQGDIGSLALGFLGGEGVRQTRRLTSEGKGKNCKSKKARKESSKGHGKPKGQSESQTNKRSLRSFRALGNSSKIQGLDGPAENGDGFVEGLQLGVAVGEELGKQSADQVKGLMQTDRPLPGLEERTVSTFCKVYEGAEEPLSPIERAAYCLHHVYNEKTLYPPAAFPATPNFARGPAAHMPAPHATRMLGWPRERLVPISRKEKLAVLVMESIPEELLKDDRCPNYECTVNKHNQNDICSLHTRMINIFRAVSRKARTEAREGLWSQAGGLRPDALKNKNVMSPEEVEAFCEGMKDGWGVLQMRRYFRQSHNGSQKPIAEIGVDLGDVLVGGYWMQPKE